MDSALPVKILYRLAHFAGEYKESCVWFYLGSEIVFLFHFSRFGFSRSEETVTRRAAA